MSVYSLHTLRCMCVLICAPKLVLWLSGLCVVQDDKSHPIL